MKINNNDENVIVQSVIDCFIDILKIRVINKDINKDPIPKAFGEIFNELYSLMINNSAMLKMENRHWKFSQDEIFRLIISTSINNFRKINYITEIESIKEDLSLSIEKTTKEVIVNINNALENGIINLDKIIDSTIIKGMRTSDELYRFLEKYENTINFESIRLMRKFNSVPIGIDDIKNHLYNFLVENIKTYDPMRGAKLETYISNIIRNAGINFCRSYTSNTHKVANYSVEYESGTREKEKGNSDEQLMQDIIDVFEGSKEKYNVYEYKILKESIFNNFSVKEISEKLNYSKQKTYRYLESGKKKFKMIWSNSSI